MIRPENISTRSQAASGHQQGAGAEEAGSGENVLAGSVVNSVYQGSANQLAVKLGSGDRVIVDVNGRNPLEVGEQVALRFAARDTWLLAS